MHKSIGVGGASTSQILYATSRRAWVRYWPKADIGRTFRIERVSDFYIEAFPSAGLSRYHALS
jgi:hypothetical protein